MLAMLKPYIISGVGILIAVLFASSLYFMHTRDDALDAAAGYKSDLSALQSKVDERNAEIEADKKNQLTIGVERAQTNQQFLDVKRSVEGAKGREEVLRAKPTLTEKMINKSFAEFADEISCATGDVTPCK